VTLLQEAIPPDNNEFELPLREQRTCEQCGESFTAQSGSGGKPQRFCSSECRLASRSGSQCASSQCASDQQNANETPNKPPTLATLETVGKTESHDDPDEFDWSGENVLIREQPATAVYFNPEGALVIRQKADYRDDDPFIYIGADHIEAFLEKLCDVCGVVKSFP
jgi:hypothetical protein